MLLALCPVLLAAVLATVQPSGASDTRAATNAPRRGGIEVAQVNGLIDPTNASLIKDTIRGANEREAEVLVIQLASGGAVGVDVDELVRAVRESRVPIAVWVGPSGGKAKGAAAVLAQAAPVVSVANGSAIGPAYPDSLDHPSARSRRQLGRRLETLAAANDRRPAGAAATLSRTLSAGRALEVGAINQVEATLGGLIVSLDGLELTTAAGTVELSTARVVGEGEARRRTPNQTVRFRKLGLMEQLEHTLTSPSIAYFLLLAGLCLVVFEFFTAAIGLAGATGAVAIVGSFVGFSHLPVEWWAVALLMVAMLGFAVDAQAGGTGAWTIIAAVCLVVGSIFLYGGSSRLDVRWWAILLVIVGTIVFMVSAVPAAIRSRFSTPTVGREGMIGEMGTAEVDVNPDGVVRIRDALWRARTNRATPITAGEPARVVEVDGLILEVEPEEGGARDYRERRGRPDPGS
ncbi:MAG TPA: NfeD family protein [Acidimicrobiia bacterium]|nr:NfeD family protein [Acidimicrobiia bacterium]